MQHTGLKCQQKKNDDQTRFQQYSKLKESIIPLSDLVCLIWLSKELGKRH